MQLPPLPNILYNNYCVYTINGNFVNNGCLMLLYSYSNFLFVDYLDINIAIMKIA